MIKFSVKFDVQLSWAQINRLIAFAVLALQAISCSPGG